MAAGRVVFRYRDRLLPAMCVAISLHCANPCRGTLDGGLQAADRPALPLAVPAPHRRALPDRGLLQRPAATGTRLPAPAVGRQFQVEVARLAIRIDEVAQRGAAAFDRIREDPF